MHDIVAGRFGDVAEYAKVPFADDSLIPTPITSQNTSTELDYLIISDIFTTAWGALTYSGFQPGDSVAIFGAGPVGLPQEYSWWIVCSRVLTTLENLVPYQSILGRPIRRRRYSNGNQM
ncbi:hypothetical protein GGI42DRAFT_311093 [Trichoderma sp. SZMC 28013]